MSFLGQNTSNVSAVAAFASSAMLLRDVECGVRDELLALGAHGKLLRFPHLDLSLQTYSERNFFSILFVSVFQSMGIASERVREYAAVLHLVRGVVTATDNILDNERKGAILVDLPRARVLPNVLSILLQNALLQRRIVRVARDDSQVQRSWGALLDALFAIGEEESHEEEEVEEVLPPAQLFDQVHRFRGANLLLLAFVVPELNEPQCAKAMAHAKAGIFRIGMALQILDDLADFEEDIRRRNHNTLRSWLVHGAGTSETGARATPVADAALAALPSDKLAQPHEVFPRATGEVMVLAIELALRGFDSLSLTGLPVDRPVACELMAAMFKLRGLPHLWERYQGSSRSLDASAFEPYLAAL